jgi:hypothetical protein
MEGIDQGMQRLFGTLQIPGLESVSDGRESLLPVGAEKRVRTVEWAFLAQIDQGLISLLSTGQIAGLQRLPQLQHVSGTVVKAMTEAAEAASFAKSWSWT